MCGDDSRGEWTPPSVRIRLAAMGESSPQSLYPQILGDSWASVHPAVQAMHLNGEPKSVSGTITIEQGKGWFGRFLVWIIGLPKERPKCEVRLVKTVIKNGERWERFFDSDQLATIQRCSPEGIWERAGIWEMLLDISVDDGALVHRQKRTRLCLGPLRLPWPRWLGQYSFGVRPFPRSCTSAANRTVGSSLRRAARTALRRAAPRSRVQGRA